MGERRFYKPKVGGSKPSLPTSTRRKDVRGVSCIDTRYIEDKFGTPDPGGLNTPVTLTGKRGRGNPHLRFGERCNLKRSLGPERQVEGSH